MQELQLDQLDQITGGTFNYGFVMHEGRVVGARSTHSYRFVNGGMLFRGYAYSSRTYYSFSGSSGYTSTTTRYHNGHNYSYNSHSTSSNGQTTTSSQSSSTAHSLGGGQSGQMECNINETGDVRCVLTQ